MIKKPEILSDETIDEIVDKIEVATKDAYAPYHYSVADATALAQRDKDYKEMIGQLVNLAQPILSSRATNERLMIIIFNMEEYQALQSQLEVER